MDELTLGLVSVALDDSDSVPVVRLAGELDVSCAEAVRSALTEALDHGHKGPVVFDLGALRFMDSSGIAVLLAISEAHGPVEVRHPSATVRRVIEVTGLAGVLRMVP